MAQPDGFRSFKVSQREGRQAALVAELVRVIRDLKRVTDRAELPPGSRLVCKDAAERFGKVLDKWEREFCK